MQSLFNWSVGVMEYWSIGVLKAEIKISSFPFFITPLLQLSNTPVGF